MTEFLRIDMGAMSRIPLDGVDNLYLGNIPNALALYQEKPKGHWAVLNCTDDPALDYLKTEPDFDVIRLDQWDGEPYPGMLVKVGIEFVDSNLKAGNNVLICCHAGMSRSPGMTVAYLMYRFLEDTPRDQQTLEDRLEAYNWATKKVRNSRPIIQIHPKIDLSIRQYFGMAARSDEDLIQADTK